MNDVSTKQKQIMDMEGRLVFARVKPGKQERGGLTKSLGLVDADCYLQN